jgi:hypothetical protein
MKVPMPGPLVALVAVAGALAAVASAAGVFLRGNLSTEVFTTARGERVNILTNGVYRFNGEAVAAEGIGWDIVTLLLVVPALFVVLPSLLRGSSRAVLFVTGLLAYFVYQYAEYSMFLAYGPLFLLYVATFATSLTGIALLVSRLDFTELVASMDERFPRRAVTAFGAFVVVLLIGMWLPLIGRSFDQVVVPELNGATTLVVQAFDLGLLVPLGLFTAVTAWRRHPAGYILGAILAVKAAAMGAGIAAMLIVEAMVTGVVQLVPMALFATISLASVVLSARVFGSIGARPDVPASRPIDRLAGRAAHG